MQDYLKDLLETACNTLKQMPKMTKKQANATADAVAKTLEFFVPKFSGQGRRPDEETLKYMIHAADIAVRAATDTGIYDEDMLARMYRSRHMYEYRDWCKFMKNGTDEDKDLMRKLDNDWISEERTYWIIDRYSEYKMVQEQLLDPAYDDRQAKAMWLYAGDYFRCRKQGFDPSPLIAPDASPHAISSVLQCSLQLLSEGADPARFLSFLKQDGFRKYTDWYLISFIAMNDFQNPATVSWKEIVPSGTPEAVVSDIAARIRSENMSGAEREDAARQVLDKWNGFTRILASYYDSIGIWGHPSIYREWQADLRDHGADLEPIALARMIADAKNRNSTIK